MVMLKDKIIGINNTIQDGNIIRLCQYVERISFSEKIDNTIVTIEKYNTESNTIMERFVIKTEWIPDIVRALHKFKMDKREKPELVKVTLLK
jgi:hypothetical protein